jgi:hypothetical protein
MAMLVMAAGAAKGLFKHRAVETFARPLAAANGRAFGLQGVFTFSMDQGGTFIIDGKSGFAWQRSDSYKDSAFIRSSQPLPKTYKISVVVGHIDYGLEKLDGLQNDPDFPEGPLNENGCYLLTITDTLPNAPHTNIWWHQHRKLVIDVDNNVWGHGMPNPVFMVYFDKSGRLMAYDGAQNTWQSEWNKAVTYQERAFYRVEVQKTLKEFILRIFMERGQLLKEGRVSLDKVWNEDPWHEDYFAIGDPHSNYYQGSMKIKEISLEY